MILLHSWIVTEKTVPSHRLHLMVAENTQKGNPPTGLRTRSCPASYRHRFFGETDFLFSSIPPSPPNKNIPYWSCPLWTPSLTLPPSSLKCLQKSNPNIHRKCFRCFRCFKCFGCFRCFISLLDHKTAPFWSKSELNPQTVTIQLCNNIIKI